ncbi:cell wall-active antibiotics response protein [Sphingobacterium sp. lm-10]|uniref:LiaF transmembrane domain-containing protein n=1 Tax=Sphingobacterium sp. lm-10 TaxID=2944904 RepID=UPI00201FEFDE|nr:LiaF domain-containing protein [Sphingobacterium sp. lm-10]MCL7987980.1 cell wall-active antibiotics response protein [Sphingobacterium sp. lm-10]
MNTQNTNNDSRPPKSNNTTNFAGAFIILFGLALLMKNMRLDIFPRWIFGWEMILIVIGLVIGVNSRFQKKSSVILIAIGSIFLLKDLVGMSFGKFFIPAMVIAMGIYLIKRNRVVPPLPPEDPTRPDDEYDWDKRVDHFYTVDNDYTADSGNPKDTQPVNASASTGSGPYANYSAQHDSYLKVDTFFSDTKKSLLTTNFLGGTITSVFGSTKVNFLQADIKQAVVLDTFQLFGSTKIIIPPHWQVSSNVASIFGELDDRRPMFDITTDKNKKIYITGTSIFGGLTIKNN